jgi:hypothetical protein
MSTDMVSRSSFTSHSITKADAYDVKEVASHAAKATEIVKAANEEIVKIGAHTISSMANLTAGAGQVRQHLLGSGYRSEIYDDAHNKTLQVTGQNLIILTNEGQKEILKAAVAYMK